MARPANHSQALQALGIHNLLRTAEDHIGMAMDAIIASLQNAQLKDGLTLLEQKSFMKFLQQLEREEKQVCSFIRARRNKTRRAVAVLAKKKDSK